MNDLVKKYDVPFLLSSISDEAVTIKVAFDNSVLLEDTLNQHIMLSKYGEGVTNIGFIFIAVPDEVNNHEQEVSYTLRKKEIFMQLKLPFALVQKSDKQQVLQLMATTYLQAMEHFLPQLHISNFDYQHFQQDLQQLFESNGWIVETPVQ